MRSNVIERSKSIAIKLGEIFVSLGLSTASFTKNLEAAKRLAFGSSKEIERSLKIIGVGLAGAAASAATALAALTAQSLRTAARTHDLSQIAGVSAETFSRLSHAAKLNSIDVDQLAKGLGKLSKFLFEASAGGEEQRRIFKVLGISYQDATGKLRPVEDVLLAVADRFKGLNSETEKVALATKLFGKTGAELLPVLNEGAAGLRKAAEESDRLGTTISTKTAASADRLADNLDRLKAAAAGFGNTILESVLPAAERLSDRTVNLAKEQERGANFARAFMAGLAGGAGAVSILSEKTQGVSAELPKFAEGAQKVTAGLKPMSLASVLLAEKLGKVKVELLDIASMFPTIQVKQPTLLGPGEATASRLREMIQPQTAEITAGLNDLSEAGRRVWEETRNPIELYRAELTRLNGLLKAGAIDQDTFERAMRAARAALGDFASNQLKGLEKGLQNLKLHMKEFGEFALRSFGELALSGGSFREILADIARQLARMALEFLVIQPLMEAIGGLFHRQHGGPVWSGGSFVVGEAGPETFVPAMPGFILPHNALPAIGGRGGAAGMVQNNYIDARGADHGTIIRLNALMQREHDRRIFAFLADKQLRRA